MNELSKKNLLKLDTITATGKTLGENIKDCTVLDYNVIRPIDNPYSQTGGIAVLKGNLAPDGSVVKRSAVAKEMLQHEGPAKVYNSEEEAIEAIYTGKIVKGDVVVIRYEGPKGGPGMPEAGYIPIPQKLAKAGVKDIIRISDGRMSGTAYGTVVLHVSPESSVGGTLALVKDGDEIETCGYTFQVIDTAGHTPGGISFYMKREGLVFTGDSLFQGSIGRTDFPGGSLKELTGTIKKNLFSLPDSTVVLSGHGEQTTIGQEKKSNPFLTGGIL